VRRIRRSESRYIDETSWRVDGKNRYMWVIVTEAESLYVIGTRSHDVPKGYWGNIRVRICMTASQAMLNSQR